MSTCGHAAHLNRGNHFSDKATEVTLAEEKEQRNIYFILFYFQWAHRKQQGSAWQEVTITINALSFAQGSVQAVRGEWSDMTLD